MCTIDKGIGVDMSVCMQSSLSGLFSQVLCCHFLKLPFYFSVIVKFCNMCFERLAEYGKIDGVV